MGIVRQAALNVFSLTQSVARIHGLVLPRVWLRDKEENIETNANSRIRQRVSLEQVDSKFPEQDLQQEDLYQEWTSKRPHREVEIQGTVAAQGRMPQESVDVEVARLSVRSSRTDVLRGVLDIEGRGR